MAIIKRLRLKNKILQESFLKIHNENRVNKISAKISVGLGYSLEDSASMKKKGDSFVLIADIQVAGLDPGKITEDFESLDFEDPEFQSHPAVCFQLFLKYQLDLKCLEDLEIKTELVTKNRVDFLSYVYDDVRMTGTYLLSQTIYKANPLPMDIYDLFHD